MNNLFPAVKNHKKNHYLMFGFSILFWEYGHKSIQA